MCCVKGTVAFLVLLQKNRIGKGFKEHVYLIMLSVEAVSRSHGQAKGRAF